MTYIVTLRHFPGAPSGVIHAAECRFQAVLDRVLGDRVVPSLKAFQNVSEFSANSLSKDEIRLAVEWAEVYARAREAGFRGLGDADEAYFEVRLE
jgi:hypothetical protein